MNGTRDDSDGFTGADGRPREAASSYHRRTYVSSEDFRVKIFDGPGGTGGDPTVLRRLGILGGPGGTGGDPTPERHQKVTGGEDPGPPLAWEQRVLHTLAALVGSVGYRNLPAELRAEILALVEDAPASAFR